MVTQLNIILQDSYIDVQTYHLNYPIKWLYARDIEFCNLLWYNYTFVWPTAGISASSILQRDKCGELCMITFSCSCISILWSIVLIHILKPPYIRVYVCNHWYLKWKWIGFVSRMNWCLPVVLCSGTRTNGTCQTLRIIWWHYWDSYTLAKKSQNPDVSAAFISDRRPKAADWNAWILWLFG